MYFTHLVCTLCGQSHDATIPQNVSTCCGKPLYACYDFKAASRTLTRESLRTRGKSLWRYREVLPVRDDADIVSLGEGFTPLLPAPRLGAKHGLRNLYIKDEAQNPTGSFKARGMTAAVSMAKQFRLKKLAAPSAGNAAGALAAYAARAGMEAHLFMPRDTPKANVIECEQMGAHVTLINGLITDCGAEVAKRKAAEGWFDVSTLKEPYRAEGKKTLGYELAEQLGWRLPDVVLYPTGGGTGLVGMWKAFDEMEQLGLLPAGTKRPRMYTVQAAGCQPIVRAFQAGEKFAAEHLGAHTRASGLRVPKAIGDFLMLDALRAS
ncbi:MAG TPA: threonine synthase, partial [Opitutaceae bacterium]